MSVYQRPLTMDEMIRRGLRKAAEQAERAAAAPSEVRLKRGPASDVVVSMVEHNGVWMAPWEVPR